MRILLVVVIAALTLTGCTDTPSVERACASMNEVGCP